MCGSQDCNPKRSSAAVVKLAHTDLKVNSERRPNAGVGVRKLKIKQDASGTCRKSTEREPGARALGPFGPRWEAAHDTELVSLA